MPTLILTPRYTPDAQALWRAAGERGWGVRRLAGWRVTDDDLAAPDPVLYVEALLGPTLAAEFGLALVEPPEDWLVRLPAGYRGRTVELTTFGGARGLARPAFVKPPNDKSFPAKVYAPGGLPDGYADDTPVLVQEVVKWAVEYRCFVLDRRVVTASVYLRDGVLQRDTDFAAPPDELNAALTFAAELLADARVDVPPAVVLDVGRLASGAWAAVELNAAWGAGIYGCDPGAVLDVLRRAAVPAGGS